MDLFFLKSKFCTFVKHSLGKIKLSRLLVKIDSWNFLLRIPLLISIYYNIYTVRWSVAKCYICSITLFIHLYTHIFCASLIMELSFLLLLLLLLVDKHKINHAKHIKLICVFSEDALQFLPVGLLNKLKTLGKKIIL